MRRQLEHKASELGVGASVQFLGARNDVAAILAKTAIVVRPSLTEGRSLTILEAMASGSVRRRFRHRAESRINRHGVTGVLTRVGDHLTSSPGRSEA